MGLIYPLIVVLLGAVTYLLDTQLFVEKRNSEVRAIEITVNKVDSIYTAAVAYHIENIAGVEDYNSASRWPTDMQELYDTGLLTQCDGSADVCYEHNTTPWGSTISIEPVVVDVDTGASPSGTVSVSRLKFTMDAAGATPTNSGDFSVANRIAGYYPNGSTEGTEITFYFDRPGTEYVHQAFTRRDGSALPTNDWNFAGYTIEDIGDLNFKDFTDSDGNPVSVLESTFDTVGLYGQDQLVGKPNCPQNYTPEIFTAISHFTGRGVRAVKLGSVQSYASVDSASGDWKIHFRYYTQDDDGNGQWEYPNEIDAKALVLTKCSKS
ncbi:hypothetical protein SAMN04488136_13058 [Vibrio xiamenensis]|uniref:Uncharacterized protein n=1 Tax=Vibrio xiamenensis TaxID=861298 RepID=A0A1G8FGZ9_9VIBR|nr:hypothetical protein [Vibrio xiamenensis]SDH81352.1 hypothetical protein SAMN04488136_13058 [Vibrio xiamenensis]